MSGLVVDTYESRRDFKTENEKAICAYMDSQQ